MISDQLTVPSYNLTTIGRWVFVFPPLISGTVSLHISHQHRRSRFSGSVLRLFSSSAPNRGYCGGIPTAVQAWQPCPLWELSFSHPILLLTRGLAVFCVHVCLLYVWVVCVPRYLGLLNRVTDISGRRSLRSSGTNRLVVPPFRLSTVGSRAFPVAVAKIWNALPDSLVSITSPSSFRHHLKTFLFQRSFS